MFDTTTADCRKAPQKIPDARPPRITGRQGMCVWEEHCVECGQPQCFKTCAKFVRGFDGKCRRLRYGIVPRQGGARVSFKEWGKLEAVYTGAVFSARTLAVFARFEQIASTCARGVNRLMSFIPGRIGAITVWRRLRTWGIRLLGRRTRRTFLFQASVWSDRPGELVFSVIQEEKECFLARLALQTGWNQVQEPLPPLAPGARLLLFPVCETEANIYFSDLVLKIASAEVLSGATDVPTEKAVVPAVGAAPFVKCVAWDLDDTLWKGILVEDGPENLVLRTEAAALVKELDGRGILNTICSKNDEEPAWRQLERLGLSDYFVFPQINWLPKSANLKRLAKVMNIGIDSFAFIDDSSFERGEVRSVLPMVRIYRETDLAELDADPAFHPSLSAESATRRLSYQKEMARQTAARSFEGDEDGFLRSCGIHLELVKLVEGDLVTRCWELVQRSNQLNLTARRYARDDFEAFLKTVDAFAIRCHDKFGDYGCVGFIALARCARVARVQEFVVSCRVARKKCEQSVLLALAERLFAEGVRCLEAELIETGRNTALIEAFEAMPFTEEAADGRRYYRLTAEGPARSNGIRHSTVISA